MTEFQGRKIYVNVAAPPKGEDGDWRAGRSGSNRRGGEDREPAPELIGVLPEILKLNYHQDKDQTD